MTKRNEIVFIDSKVDQPQHLAALVEQGIVAYELDPAQPALAQMLSILAARKSAYDAIHVFSHGSTASIDFAAGSLNSSTLALMQTELAGIGAALSRQGSLNFWSCDVASNEAGLDFVEAISTLIDRPVAAASGKVGSSINEGSWTLDARVGIATVALPLSARAAATYSGIFANNNATTSKDTITQTTGSDTLTVTSSGQIVSTDKFDGAAGTDTIVISGTSGVTVNLSTAGVTSTTGFKNYEALSINNTSGTSTVTLNANQIVAGGISTSLNLIGAAGTQSVIINNASNFTAAAFTFTSWTNGTDKITINGTSGNDTITGSSQNDILSGAAGNDTLDGGAGADTMTGGLGDDTFVVDNASDVVTENASEGTDTVQSSITYTIGNNVENLTLTGAATINGTGNTLNNTLTGNTADNILDGGAGNDTLIGGTGNDTYIVDSTSDVVTEAASAGTDLVKSSVSYTLATNVENLLLTGSAHINATGNAAVNTLTGNTGNNILDGGAGADTMVGGTGDDTYVVDNVGDVVTENASEGTDTIQTALAYTLGTNFENLTLTGTGHVNGTGNAVANTITGNSGNNTLDGGAGNDTLIGGAGNDTYLLDSASDVVSENASEGTDTVQAAFSYTLTNNVENLILTGSANVNATGNALANTLTGNSGNNILDGGAGADTMVGGLGDDTYVVDDAGDVITEAASAGTDTVLAAASHVLGNNLENLTLTGTADINGTGNTGANTITGNSGNNTLNGGAGNDTLIGGLGDDTYVVDNINDVVVENVGEGNDTITVAWSYTVGANIENATLSGTADLNLTGNSGINTLTGNSGDNTLDGGAGADVMAGGLGNDTYVVDDAGDVVTEAASAGTDTVQAAASYVLGSNIENLLLTGSGNIDGTGNSAINTITGNTGNNTLDGGAGADTLIGGSGDDTYLVDNAGDVIVENNSEGTDTVKSSASFVLKDNLENLVLTGIGNINGTGNSGNNTITGNDGDNVLDGGAGDDVMIGGKGNDTYVINGNDTVIEEADGGYDTIKVTGDFVMFDNIENVILTGVATKLTGNNGDNVLVGNALANELVGLGGNDSLDGGTGADTLIGGTGDDTYYIDNVGDVIVENADEGSDTVYVSTTYTVAENLENVVLAGTSAINATGNSADNIITGNSAINNLFGMDGNDTLNGGVGADIMTGGNGDDTYYVDNKKDKVIELASQGTDTVYSTIAFTLGADVENLVLLGTGGIAGTGNALNNTITGNDGGNALNGGAGADTLTGGRGNDTYFVDNIGDVVTELENEGTDLVQSSISYILAATLEKLTLTGSAAINGTGNDSNNTLTGNSGANTLTGYAGNDVLNGGAGADTLIGGQGNDEYVVDNIGDTVTEAADEGEDVVTSSVTFTLGANLERLILTGSAVINGAGNELDNIITGNKAVNTLYGYAGNDVLNGGVGSDKMFGGLGDDKYIVDATGDVVTENADEGTDLVESVVTYTLGANLENLTLTGSKAINGTGNAENNVLQGNTGNNTLYGLAGNDTLNGGKGNDTLIGGQGDDNYVVDATADVVTELFGEGYDIVTATVNYTIGANVEELILGGTAKINGTGNATDNIITGNISANIITGLAGNDTLDGGGGIDTLIGGQGDDTYFVDVAGDIITELANEGTDSVMAKNSYTLSANVENLTLVGSGSINGTGNASNNNIAGNNSNNLLDGGAGADTLTGLDGNDTYTVDNTGDVIVEAASEGYDRVNSSVTYTLSANVEELTLTGTSAINGTGNSADNELNGNSAANVLSGGAGLDEINGGDGADTITGGLDADTLTGGLGNDTFVYTALLDSKLQTDPYGATYGVDVITDFLSGDKINMSAIDANTASGGDQAFVVDTNGTIAAGEVKIEFSGSINTLSFYIDGDSIADMTIVVQSSFALTASDFIL
jgi:Ca2+-binding RTX toxin-like protein